MYWILIFSFVLFRCSFVTGQVETEEEIGQLLRSIAVDHPHHKDACNQSVSQIESLDFYGHFNGTSWNLLLNCASSIGKSLTELSWHYQGKILMSERNFNMSTNVIKQILKIENLTQSQLGEYTCLSTNCAGYAHDTIQPQILPILTVSSSIDVPNEVGKRIEANCTSFADSQLYWKVMENGRQLEVPGEIQNTIDAHGNVISSLVHFIHENNTLIHLHCCRQMLHFLDQNLCSSVYIPVYSPLKLISYQSSIDNWNASLMVFSCNFTGFPLPTRIFWTICSLNSEFNCIDVTSKSITNTSKFYVETQLTIIATNSMKFTCSANNFNNQTAFYDFKLTQWPLPKQLLTSNFTIINGSKNDYEVIFECKFNGQRSSCANWIKLDWNGEENLIADNIHIFITNATSENGFDNYCNLRIRPYTNNYYGTYYCQIVNDNGYFRSSLMTPFFSSNLDTGEVQIASNSSVCEESKEVHLTCFREGTNFLPGDLWKVNVVSELSLNYTTITGNGWVKIKLNLDEISDYIHIQCELMNVFPSENKTKIALSLLNNCSDGLRLVSTKHCRSDDFLDGNSCDLICTVYKPPSAILKGHYWIYFSMIGNNSYYFLTENSSAVNISPYRTNYTLSLSTYFAGHYQCFSTYFDYLDYYQLPVSYVFKIDPEESGSLLNEECDNHTSCLAYNSVCDDRINFSEKLCQCQDPLNIPMDFNVSTSACVGPVKANEFCYNNLQCELGQFNYNCTDNRCVCDAFLVQVAEVGGLYRCENSVGIGEFCTVDIQCQLFDEMSICNNDTATCECINDYEFKDYKHSCGPDDVLSGGAIAGVVIGCVAALVLLGFFCCLGREKWNFRRNRILNSQTLTLDEQDLEEEMDFPQFNSFAQFPEFQDDDEA